MADILYIVIAIIAFVFGGFLMNTKNKRTLELYKEEADKQAGEVVKAKADSIKSDKEADLSKTTANVSSEIIDAVMKREEGISSSDDILKSPSTVLSDEEKENAKKILSDNN